MSFGRAAQVRLENLNNKKKQKIRHFQTPSMLETTQLVEQIMQEQEERNRKQTRKWWSSTKQQSLATEVEKRISIRHAPKRIDSQDLDSSTLSSRIPVPIRFQEQFATISNKNEARPSLLKQSRPDRHLLEAKASRMPVPSLFLQELAHLFSLLSGVAMSTLRNDLDCAEIPLVEYFPGK
jgi:hypothetical protein